MTSNAADINNEILTSEKDRGNYNIQPPANPTLEQMQVARKESSSGFMLLSVRHTSNVGNLSNGRETHPLVENYDENYVRAATMQATSNTVVANNPDMSRHFSSTMSLEAEEYDNNEDNSDLHSEPNQFSHNQQQQHQFVMRNPPSNFNPARVCWQTPIRFSIDFITLNINSYLFLIDCDYGTPSKWHSSCRWFETCGGI